MDAACQKPPAAAAKGQGRSPCGVWGGTPKPYAAALALKRANSPKGYKASDSHTLLKFFDSLKPKPAGRTRGFGLLIGVLKSYKPLCPAIPSPAPTDHRSGETRRRGPAAHPPAPGQNVCRGLRQSSACWPRGCRAPCIPCGSATRRIHRSAP